MKKGILAPYKRPFFGIRSPKILHAVLPDISAGPAEETGSPKKIILISDQPYNGRNLQISCGEAVRRGQPVFPFSGSDQGAVLSTVCGEISSIEPATGPDGRPVTRIEIVARTNEEWDEGPGKEPDIQKAGPYLAGVPGGLDLASLVNPMHPVHCLVVMAADADPMSTAAQHASIQRSKDVAAGIAALKAITGISRVEAAAFAETAKTAASWDIPVKILSPRYPDVNPRLICRRHYGVTIGAGSTPLRQGFAFVSAEAVAAVGGAFHTGRVKGEKIVTLVPKDLTEKSVNFRVRIGAPVRDVLEAGRVVAAESDRVVLGGPFTGYAAADLDEPVTPQTSSIMIQDADGLSEIADSACFNCGECVRICPAKMPVNMLIRYLDNGMWDEAARCYDLLSCVECGLCSFVCPARIPIFQQIMLGRLQYENSLEKD